MYKFYIILTEIQKNGAYQTNVIKLNNIKI